MIEHSSLRQLSPVVKQLIVQVTELFIEYVGPIGDDVAQDVFSQWLAAGKFNPAAVRHYALGLGEHLDKAQERQVFLQKAEKLMLQ
jgi:hypothetical protein